MVLFYLKGGERMYYPVLKPKKGEFNALKNINSDLSKFYHPIFYIEYEDNEQLISTITKIKEETTKNFDIKIKTEVPLDNDFQEKIINHYSDIDFIINIIDIKNNNIMVNSTNIIPSFKLDQTIIDVKSLNLSTLFIDLEFISLYKTTSEQILINFIKTIPDDVKIILFGSSVPASLGVPSDQNITLKRHEQYYYNKIKDIKSNIFFSDFTTQYMENFEATAGIRTPIQIKYTLNLKTYCYRNGITAKHGTLNNMQELCYELINTLHPNNSHDFNYSWADKKISDLANKTNNSPGNATSWVSWNVNRHITYIIKEYII